MVNPDALNIAKVLDVERQNGNVRSLMHGIPVLLKDNINTGDKQTTTGGATILKNHIAKQDASLVKHLREQGAIILGKTNLTELACFKTFTGVNGYSSLGGYVLCPWDIKEDPSGSSTGSAVSMALQLAPVAIGTETGGSIMSPSMKNGVVGLKPTIGMVPRTGILPISSTLDTAGPMSYSVTNVAALLTSMRSNDPTDPVTLTKPDTQVDYLSYLTTKHVKRIGVVKTDLDKLSETRKAVFTKTCKTLESLGYELVDVDLMQVKLIYPIMKYEFKAILNRYFFEEGLAITLADVIKHNETFEKENLKYGQDVLIEAQYQTSGKLYEQEYMDALQERIDATAHLNELFTSHKLDMLYVATYTSLGPECGFPTLSVPIGLDEKGMPIGTYFLAPQWQEGYLIEIGYALEQALKLQLNPLKK
jgi:amidase